MPLNPKLSNESVNAEADAACALANTGYLRIYNGTQAATADTAIGAQVLLAELTFNATAFAGAVAGVATANVIVADSSANATGTAAWFRALKSNGTSPLFDGTVGTAAKTISAVSQANPAVMTKVGHGLVTGSKVLISGFTGAWVPANALWVVTYVSADTFSIPVDSSGFGAIAGSPVYADADLVLDSVSIVLGGTVSVTGFTFTALKA